MKFALVIIFALVFISCQQNTTEKPIEDKSIIISDTWMRPGLTDRNTAAFMTIKNNTDMDDTLFAVSSDLAKVVEIHETYKKENDMMGMRHVDYLVIPKNSTLELKPRSYHVMLLGLNKDLGKGINGEITLAFRKFGSVKVTAGVK